MLFCVYTDVIEKNCNVNAMRHFQIEQSCTHRTTSILLPIMRHESWRHSFCSFLLIAKKPTQKEMTHLRHDKIMDKIWVASSHQKFGEIHEIQLVKKTIL